MASAQFVVTSVELDNGDAQARVHSKQDRNGQWCSLLKIQTKGINEEMRHKFTFGADMSTQIVETSFPTGAIWVYLSPGRPTLLIKHPDLGNLTYEIPVELMGKSTYQMVLELASATLVIRCTPSDADILVDDIKVGTGEINIPVTAGVEHRWKLENPFYYTKSGVIKINEKETKTLTEKLEPAYGYVKINTSPENGATVFIDGVEMPAKTPYLSDKLVRGDHRIEVKKDLYTTFSDIVFLDNGQKVEIDAQLQPNYAEITVETENFAEIWVNGEKKSIGKWSGLVDAGTCRVEARKQGYSPVERTLILNVKENKTISLGAPSVKISNETPQNIYYTKQQTSLKKGDYPQRLTFVRKSTSKLAFDGNYIDKEEARNYLGDTDYDNFRKYRRRQTFWNIALPLPIFMATSIASIEGYHLLSSDNGSVWGGILCGTIVGGSLIYTYYKINIHYIKKKNAIIDKYNKRIASTEMSLSVVPSPIGVGVVLNF